MGTLPPGGQFKVSILRAGQILELTGKAAVNAERGDRVGPIQFSWLRNRQALKATKRVARARSASRFG